MKNQNRITITVVDFNSQPVSTAEVTISAKRERIALRFDKESGAYVTEKFNQDRYVVTVAEKNLETQERSVFIGKSGADELFILGKKGMPFYYRGVVKVPFEPIKDYFGVAVPVEEFKAANELFRAIAKRYQVEPIKTSENFLKNGLGVFAYPKGASEEERQKLLTTIQRLKGVLTTGPVLKQNEKNATLLTDEIVVRFKGGIAEKEVRTIAKRLGLVIIRTIPYAGNAYQFKVSRGGSTYKSLEICQQLVDMKVVDYAEPNLFHTFEEDAITPTNYLFPEQWDHPIINTPDAWQVLNDNLSVAQRFGNPDVVVAVVDSGVNTNHPQFNGTVSNGQPKLFTTFDFSNMVANNNSLVSSHGTNCASASVGFTSTTSVMGGVPDGTVGIAGNCRLMGIRRGGTEADYSDMYIWIAGFDPNSSRAGFPTQLSRGADVITNSFGFSVGSPISGLMSDTFDHLTTYGRGGKGIVLTFSVGNYATNSNFHLQRPWAAYGKTFACGASSLGNNGTTEIIAAYSGSGTLLDFCAPSHDAYVGDGALHNPPQNYGALTATVLNGVSVDDANMPRNRERLTSLSAAAVAGATSITVASATGFVNGQAIIIGNPSANVSPSEAKRITGITGNTVSFTPALFNNKANGTAVAFGNRDYQNAFGGTSYATPVCAGVAALMLSVNNKLTWIEVREILRETATKIDPGNTNATGRWRDTMNRISTDPGYTGPFFSQFFGYGRINAALAVSTAHTYPSERDIMVRDNMADTGTGTATSPHWHGVDIWVRNANDGITPANYATSANTVHQSPIAGQNNWLNVRYKNRGTVASYPFYIRTYIVHYAGAEFIYPDNFIPTVRPNGVIPNPLTFGTYLIGEQLVNPVAAGADDFVTFEWDANLIPPETVLVDGINVRWHPCILVEVSPHDGFVATGNHVWDDNNLAQKNISIVYSDSGSDNASFIMLGNPAKNRAKSIKVEVFATPKVKVPYFIYFADPKMNEYFQAYAKKNLPNARIGTYKRKSVVWLLSSEKTVFELPYTGLMPMIAGLGKVKRLEADFDLNVIQYTGKKVSGSCGISFRNK